MTLDVSLENHFQLFADNSSAGDSFAFYLYRGNEVVERIGYGPSRTHRFVLSTPGPYRVKAYARAGGVQQQTAMSPELQFRGFPDIPPAPARPPYALLGVTRTSAFVAQLLVGKQIVTAYVDPTGRYVGSTFFGLPVVDRTPEGTALVGHENYVDHDEEFEPFSLTLGSADIVSREMHRYGAMDLYRISHAAHLNGLSAGGYFIQSFIMAKYNCRIPHTAVIGEGTRMAIGGVGSVIHPRAVIGSWCVIGQNVTIGGRAHGSGSPVIGNNVFISPGAKCLGGRIGSNVVVGANAVVLHEVPDNCVVAGVPARVISTDMERYRSYTHGSQR